MKKVRIIVTGVSIVMIAIIGYYSIFYESNGTIIENTNLVKSNTSNAISMMLETDYDSGMYEVSSDTSWPSSGYSFNETLSKCSNGSTISYDKDTNTVYFSGVSKDYCYVYFDKTIALSDYIIGLYTTDGENNLYYFDGSGDYTNASLEAVDYSYRYSGASDSTSNFVCFGSDDCTDEDNLYRIIGLFLNEKGEYEAKLIKYDYCTSDMCGEDGDYMGTFYNCDSSFLSYYIGNLETANIASYYWNYTNASDSYSNSGWYNDWSYSALNKVNLNNYYLENIGIIWSDLIIEHTWIVGGNTYLNLVNTNALSAYKYEILNPISTTNIADTLNSKVGLVYVSDYFYASNSTYWGYPGLTYKSYPDSNGNYGENYDYRAATSSNWMYMGLNEFTITRFSDNTYVLHLDYTGCVSQAKVSGENTVTDYLAIRPAFYLSSSVQYSSGSGTQSDPIILVNE